VWIVNCIASLRCLSVKDKLKLGETYIFFLKKKNRKEKGKGSHARSTLFLFLSHIAPHPVFHFLVSHSLSRAAPYRTTLPPPSTVADSPSQPSVPHRAWLSLLYSIFRYQSQTLVFSDLCWILLLLFVWMETPVSVVLVLCCNLFDYVENCEPGDEHNTDIVIRLIKDVAIGSEICCLC
jgi:hypothetical protein